MLSNAMIFYVCSWTISQRQTKPLLFRKSVLKRAFTVALLYFMEFYGADPTQLCVDYKLGKSPVFVLSLC